MGTIGEGPMGDWLGWGIMGAGASPGTSVVAEPVPRENDGCGDETAGLGD